MKDMKRQWQLQDAKNRLSRLVAESSEKGPQTITVRGEPKAVVVSVKDYRRMSRSGSSLVEFLTRSPWRGVDLDIKRSPDTGREIGL